MCDGMGWFSKNDFKRALLLYDRIMYLVPSRTVEFRDVDGRPKYILIPRKLQEVGVRFQYYEPNDTIAQGIVQSSKIDAERTGFRSIIARIPETDRIYTWRITNADADLGRGSSLTLHPDQEVLAHALLLNKFLIAAESLDAVPITGKSYIHALIGDKYRLVRGSAEVWTARVSNPSLNPIAVQVIQAIVSEEELERHSEVEIVEYKEKHKRLFETFSYTIRKLVKQVSAIPESPEFDRQVSDLVNTEVWHDKTEVEQELQGAWADFFKSTVKSAVVGAVTLGITPFLSLGRLSIASLFAGLAATAPWATSELINLIEKRKRAEQHGMYYLMNFNS
jgi:hypothetical protein